MNISPEQIKAARNAGYNDSEIADYLSQQGFGDRINQARQHNYSDDEIISFLENSSQNPEQKIAQTSPERKISQAESAITGISQGATANFGDEIIAGLSTPVIYGGSKLAEKFGYDTKGLSKKSLLEIYRAEQQKGQKDIKEAEKQNPGSYLTGNVGGSLYSLGSGTKATSVLANYLKSGNLPTRIAKAAPVAYGFGALSGAGEAEPGLENIAKKANEAGTVSAALSPAVPVAGSAISKFLAKKPQKTAEEVQKAASALYKQADEQGGLLLPSFTEKFLAKAENLKPQTEAGRLVAGDNAATKISEKLQSLKGRALNLQEAQEIDEFLGDAVDDLSDKGVLTKQAKKVLQLQTDLRNMIDNAPDSDINFGSAGKEGFQALKEGRRLWSRAAKLRDVEKIISRAEMTDNPATAIKTGFRNLYHNSDRMRGFTPEERKMIKNAAESGIVSDTLRTLGSRLNPIAALAGGGFGSATAAQAISLASRGAATKLQVNKAKKLADMIANSAIPTKQPQSFRNPYAVPAFAGLIGSYQQ